MSAKLGPDGIGWDQAGPSCGRFRVQRLGCANRLGAVDPRFLGIGESPRQALPLHGSRGWRGIASTEEPAYMRAGTMPLSAKPFQMERA